MTSTLRKLRTVREKPVKPAGLTLHSDRFQKANDCYVDRYGVHRLKGDPPKLMIHEHARNKCPDDSRGAIELAMDTGAREWLEPMTLGLWRDVGQSVIDAAQAMLTDEADPLDNPLADAATVPFDGRLAVVAARKLGLVVYRAEVAKAIKALLAAYGDACEMARERRTISAKTSCYVLGLSDGTEDKLSRLGLFTIGRLIKWSPRDLKGADGMHNVRLDAAEIEEVVACLEGWGWSLAADRPLPHRGQVATLARE